MSLQCCSVDVRSAASDDRLVDRGKRECSNTDVRELQSTGGVLLAADSLVPNT